MSQAVPRPTGHYTLADGLITRMDVRQPETGGKSASS